MEKKFIQTLVALGVPGVALGIFYLLLRQFGFSFSTIGPMESAGIAVLFLLIVGSITFYAIHRWAPPKDKEKPFIRSPQVPHEDIEKALLGNDEINLEDVDMVLKDLFKDRQLPFPPPPDGPNHILTFLQEPISTGEGLLAGSIEEAWVMAYIEKHMGDFDYKGRPVYTYGDRNGKRNAIIKLVKEQGYDRLLNEISPKA